MSLSRCRASVVSIALLVLSCGSCTRRDEGERRAEEQASLGGQIAARVGVDVIPLTLVASVAAAQQVSPRVALDHLVADALSANGARERHLDGADPARWLLVAARARWVADRTLEAARASGPPTAEEIAKLTELHWREVDRPPAVRIVHAVALRPKDPHDDARARALAAELRAAVLSARDEADFTARAKAVAHPAELDVRVESLPAFTSDGTLVEQGGAVVEPFARGAFTISQPGDTSGIVETTFGWHVIRLLERLPEQRMPLEARRAAFAQEAVVARAHQESEARLRVLRAATPVVVEPSAENLMQSLLSVSAAANALPGPGP
ncbi:MAG: Peptidyl-prolyl cis-trans isomerase PpiD [Labilithrix sp.]|nr:Peptidyl-prolyl cis-trans isomerase PpiD [Labilithrix sp.]